jgi:hypothetical protein
VSFLAAAPHHLVPTRFESSFMVVQPETSLFQEMTHYIKSGDIYVDNDTSYESAINISYTVNDFLNEKMYPYWFTASITKTTITTARLESTKYNVPYEWTFHESIWLKYNMDMKLFHFTSPSYQPQLIIRQQQQQ